MNLLETRKLLDSFLEKDGGDNWWIRERFMKHVLPFMPQEIKVVSLPPEKEEENFNCFIFALGLHNNFDFLKLSKGFIYNIFFQHLISIGYMVEVDSPQYGDIVAYRNIQVYGEEITHVAVVIDQDYVISKTSWGPTLLHPMLCVPLDWGSDLKYYHINSHDKLIEEYKKYYKLI